MEPIRYTIIKTDGQYNLYCKRLETILFSPPDDQDYADDVELLTMLIERWDDEHYPLQQQDPIPLLKIFMADHRLTATDLSKLLGISKSVVSEILNLKRGLSKDVIRKLAAHFCVRQEAFNRPYPLKNALNSHLRDARVMNTTKHLEAA